MPFTSTGLRDRHPKDRLRLVSLGPQFVHQTIQFFEQARLKVADRLTIRTRRAGSAADLLKGLRKCAAIEESIIQAVEDFHDSLDGFGYLRLVADTSLSTAFIRLATDSCAIPVKGNLRFGSWLTFRFDGRDQ